ncbi:MAG: hypothetical protein D3909_16155, partial [Candidatus Electrothrix sp. ATG1]|nr:hypothetical protein [Candidatus Electrothrix sp. ATG1]
QYLHGLNRPCHEEGMQCPLQNIQQHDAPAVLEHNILDRQGNERILEVHTHPVQGLQLDDEKMQTIEYCIDITRRKKLEATSLKNSKMEMVATLAGGIAHDFNNLLMAIVGNIELAAMNMSPGHNSAEFLDYATKASLQAKELTRKFLLFSNFDPPTRQAVPLDDLIIASCQAVINGSDIVPKFHFPSDLWMSYVDPGQLDQALRELFINAREAMGDKGELTLIAENITRSEQTHPERAEGEYIRITLQDQGGGIDAKNLANVFDPYFSSKIRGNGKGMGLGLTIASSIIHQHQGEIDITSTPGEGTTLHIELPAVTE